jgi:hypothetical protein
VTSVSLARSTFSDQERVTVTAAVANRSDKPVASDSLTLEIGGRGIQTEPLNVAPNGSASVAFAPFTVPSRNMRVSVRAGKRRARDRQRVQLRRLAGGAGPRDRRGRRRQGGGGLYLTRALSIGDAPHFDTVLAAAGEPLRR